MHCNEYCGVETVCFLIALVTCIILLYSSLRCTVDEVLQFLAELEAANIVQKLQNEWIRVGAVNSSKFLIIRKLIAFFSS